MARSPAIARRRYRFVNAPLLTADEVAEILRVSRSRVYELARTGKLGGAVHLGRQLRIKRDAFEQWLNDGGAPLDGGWRHNSDGR